MSTRTRRRPPGRALLLVTLLLALPLFLWVVQWQSCHWIPQGDQAIAAFKTQDVFSHHPPLQGMRSTSADSVPGAYAHHPGPIQFYAMALPYFVAGFRPVGLLAAGAIIGLCFIAISVRQGWWAAGWRGVFVAGLSVLGVEFAVGSAVILPWNVYPPMLALVAVLVTAWRLARGDSRALPWFAGTLGFVLQGNLFYVPTLAPLMAVLLVLGLVRWYLWRGRPWPLPGEGTPYRAQRWWRRPGFTAALVWILVWLPAIVELFVLHPNNLQELGALAVGSAEKRVAFAVLGSIVGVVALVGVGWWTVRRGQPSLLLSGVTVGMSVGLGLGVALLAGGSSRVYYAIMATALPFFLVGVVVARWIPLPRAVPHRRIVVPVVGLALLGLAAMIGPSMLETGRTHEEQANSDGARRDIAAALAQYDRKVFGTPPVEFLSGGYRTSMSSVPALMLVLHDRGDAVYTPRVWPHAEDDDARDAKYEPQKRIIVQLFDDKPAQITVPWEWPAVKVGS